MVEFPLVVWRSAFRVLRRQFEIYLRCRGVADINFTSSSRRPTQADMWETNTFPASFHARLNVARRLTLPLPCGGGDSLHIVINSLRRLPASGSAPPAYRPVRGLR